MATKTMYHRKRFETLLLAVLFGLMVFSPVRASNDIAVKPAMSGVVAKSGDSSWPLPPTSKLLKKRPQGIEIYQFDTSPIGNRAPLLMIHGLLGEYWDCFRWRKLSSHLKSDPQFDQRYKILFARYDTHLPLKDVVPQFRKVALEVSNASGGQPLNVVALSMGGNVVQEAMTDQTFDKRIKSVMTLGTPFHGSPLFTSNWMEYSMLKHYRSPISRLDTALPYKLYFNRHKNLLADLRWDNTDGLIPDVGNFKYLFPLFVRGTLSPSGTSNTDIAQLNNELSVDKSKFTVYGGYLLNDYAKKKGPNEFASVLKIPYNVTFTLVPEHFGREHPVLRALNQHIARAITVSDKYAYGMNDGIAPVTSSLFLPNAALQKLSISDGNLANLVEVLDVKRARLFRNIDHLTFIDDYHPFGAASLLKDELAPTAGTRSIFDWIKSDLLI